MDATLDAILQRVVDIKGSLQELMVKTEREGEHGDWPSYLNSFSVISAQVSIHYFGGISICSKGPENFWKLFHPLQPFCQVK